MRTVFFRLALASCLLTALPVVISAAAAAEPTRVPPEARWTAISSEVEARIESLLETSLSDAGKVSSRIDELRVDPGLSPAERDAVLYGYLQRLRRLPPGTLPSFILDRLSAMPPLAVTGHEEGPHHPVPLFNVAAAARGLANEWDWREGFEQVTRSADTAALAGALATAPADGARYRGMVAALEQLPRYRHDELALQCASTPIGCGPGRVEIELARGNVGWLETWIASAQAPELAAQLPGLRRQLAREAADALMLVAMQHPDKSIAALAMSDLTDHLPKSPQIRREWGTHLVGLLDDPALGGAAALQLARMDNEDWLQAAASRPLGEAGRRRLELLAELESALESGRPDPEDAP
jgi:hypothetical protein